MKIAIPALGCLTILSLALLYVIAVFAYLTDVLGWSWFPAAIVSIFITIIPFVGTIYSIIGATTAWGWSISSSIIVFCWPFLVLFIIAIATFVIGMLARRAKLD